MREPKRQADPALEPPPVMFTSEWGLEDLLREMLELEREDDGRDPRLAD